ncbi:unnamed protein product [Brassica oleracea]
MDESDGIGATVIQTPRRNVRRKLVQSTLLPHKSDDVIEPSGDRKCDAREKEEGEGGDGDLCSSQGKKRRKKRNKASKKDVIESSGDRTCNAGNKEEEGEGGGGDGGFCSSQGKKTRKQRTPKKNGASNNKMAKGNSPGKSTPRKNATKNETLAANDHMNVSPSLPNLRLEAKLRAENWTFTEQTSTTWSPHQPIKSDPITHRLKKFDLNEMPALSHPDVCIIDDEEPEQYASQSEGIAAASPVVLISYPEASDKAEPRNRLWVDKYQPRSASEFLQVCGNTDSVKLMNEWLGQWHERGFQPSKDFLSSDEEKSQDADYKCSESDSDSENTGAQDRLKNVLLIVGPVGSNASECRSGAVVRQKFGEALKSYSLSRSLEPLFNSCTDGNGVCTAEEVKVNPARKAKNTANPYSFDHEAGHALLPKIITQDFPSQLSQYVESEIAKSLSTAEESYNTVEIFVEKVENEKMLNRYWRQGAEKNSIEAKKAAMLGENICVEDYDELEDVLSVPFELSNTSYQAMSFSRSNRRRKLNVVMSSDSDDEPVKETVPLAADPSVIGNKLLSVSQSVDVSCVPESSYVPETLMDSEAELSPRAVSCGHFDGRVEVSMSEDVAQLKEIYIDRFQSFDCFKNTCETIAESSDGTMMMEDCFKEYLGSSQKMRQVTDECSRIDFGTTLKTAKKTKLDTVQESWKKLCSSHTDMKPYLDSEPVAMEPTMNVSGDLDTSGYVLEQMTSIVPEQGFSFFTNQIATTVSFPTLSATMVLVVDETKKDHTWSGGSCLDLKPETHLDVLNVSEWYSFPAY